MPGETMAERRKHLRGRQKQSGDADLWLPVADLSSTPSATTQETPWPQETADRHPSLPPKLLAEPGKGWRFTTSLRTHVDRLVAPLVRLCAEEVDRGALFLWSPVAFGLGILLYFVLPREPWLSAFALALMALVVLARMVGPGRLSFAVISAMALVCAGTFWAQLHTRWEATDMLSAPVMASVTGQIMKVEQFTTGRTRFTLQIVSGLRREAAHGQTLNRPKVVRVSSRKPVDGARVGLWLKGRARLAAPSGPAFPGSYNFAFQGWFSGLAASGFFLGQPALLKHEPDGSQPPSFAHSFRMTVEEARNRISNLIRSQMLAREGGLAAALIVGDRSGIDEQTSEVLRQSGLAHILAISGLHMALVSLTVMISLRAFLAFFPAIVLRYPIRKWAASGALFFAAGYLLLSGASVSTQRAFIMIAIMLLAVLLDRRALTMRNVAIAAFAVLLVTPSAVLTPGFQMSFAAVAALIATYEYLINRKSGKAWPRHWYSKGLRLLARYAGGLLITALVAGLATGTFAAFHFQRVAPLGLLGNLLAMPLVSLLVMPFALLSVVAMPFGLEQFPLSAMGHALVAVVEAANWVTNFGQTGKTGWIGVEAAGLASLGLLAATLFRTRLRWLSVPLFVMAVVSVWWVTPPDVFILENGEQIAVRDENGALQVLRPRAEKFSTRMWFSAFDTEGLNRPFSTHRRSPYNSTWACDELGCSYSLKGVRIVHLRNTQALVEDCELADLIVTPFQLEGACPHLERHKRPLIIDRARLQQFGAHTLTLAKGPLAHEGKPAPGRVTDQPNSPIVASDRFTIETAIKGSGRPWNEYRLNQ